MNARKNTAQVAVVAELCPKLAPVGMPTTQQTMLAALAYVQNTLESLVEIYRNDDDWDDDDTDVSYAVYSALEHVKHLRNDLPQDSDVFDRHWFMATAAINLSVRAFSRTDCVFYNLLISAQKKFDVLVGLVEFAEVKERRHAA